MLQRMVKISEKAAKQLEFLKKTGVVKDEGEILVESIIDLYAGSSSIEDYNKMSAKEREEEKQKVVKSTRDESDKFWDWFDRGMDYLDRREV